MNIDKWQESKIAKVLSQVDLMFIMWSIKTNQFNSKSEFSSHIGATLQSDLLIDLLSEWGLIKRNKERLILTDLGEEVISYFEKHSDIEQGTDLHTTQIGSVPQSPDYIVHPYRPIRHPLRVFISSSTFGMSPYRQIANEVVSRLGEYPTNIGPYGGAVGETSHASIEAVREADVFVGIIAWRYGTIKSNENRSIIHQEYDEAVRFNIPRLIFLASEATKGRPYLFPLDTPDLEHTEQLEAFRRLLQDQEIVDWFTTPEDLGMRLFTALSRLRTPDRDRPIPPRNLPPRALSFVGREQQLIQIDADLREHRSIDIASAITGMGGVGKSALASDVVYHLAQDSQAFPGGITWMRCNHLVGFEGLNQIYDQIFFDWSVKLEAIDLTGASNAQAECALREQVLGSRLTLAGPALVLLDNVEAGLPLRHLVQTLTPNGFTVLVTTRTQFAFPEITSRPLDLLISEEAVTLLRERYMDKWNTTEDQVAALEVVRTLGYLPLAIELAAARASQLHKQVTTLGTELREAGILGKLNDPSDAERNIRYQLSLSLEVLTPNERLGFAAWASTSQINLPQRVLFALWQAMTPEEDPVQILDHLLTLSLVQLDTVKSIARARMHPLLQALVREQWQQEVVERQQRARAALLQGVLAFTEEYQRHFDILAQDEALIVEMVRRGSATPGLEMPTIALTKAIDNYLDLQGRWELRQELLHLCLTLYHTQGDRLGEGQTLGNLGNVAKNQGRDEEAIAYYEQALAILREVGDHRGEGTALNNLGLMNAEQGRDEEAIAYYEQALAILREIGDRLGESRTLNNLGLMNAEQGRDKEAIAYYEQALAILREVGDRRGEGNILNNLGIVTKNQGRDEEAIAYYEQALAILREIGDRRGEGRTLNNLGSLATAQGRYEETIAYYEQSLLISREIGDRRGEANAFQNLGHIAQQQKRNGDAHSLFTQARDLYAALGLITDRADAEWRLAQLDTADSSILLLSDAPSFAPEVIEEPADTTPQMLPWAPMTPPTRGFWPWQRRRREDT